MLSSTLFKSFKVTFSLPQELQVKILEGVDVNTLLPLLEVSEIIKFMATRKLTITDAHDSDTNEIDLNIPLTDLFKYAKFHFHSIVLNCSITDSLLISPAIQDCDQLIFNSNSFLSSDISNPLVNLLYKKKVQLTISNPKDLLTLGEKLKYLQEFINFIDINIKTQIPEPLGDLELEKSITQVPSPEFLGLPSDVVLESLTSNTVIFSSVLEPSDFRRCITHLEIQVNDMFNPFGNFGFLSHFIDLKKLKITGITERTDVNFDSLVATLSNLDLCTLHLKNLNSESMNLSKLYIPKLILTSCNFANTDNNLSNNKLTKNPFNLTLIDCHFNFFQPVKLPTSLESLKIEFNSPKIIEFEISDLINLQLLSWYNYSIEFPLTLNRLPPNLINLSTNVTNSPYYQKLIIPSSVKYLLLDIQLSSTLHNTLQLPPDLECLIVHSKHLESNLKNFVNLQDLRKLVRLELWHKTQGLFSWADPPFGKINANDEVYSYSNIHEVLIDGYRSFDAVATH